MLTFYSTFLVHWDDFVKMELEITDPMKRGVDRVSMKPPARWVVSG